MFCQMLIQIAPDVGPPHPLLCDAEYLILRHLFLDQRASSSVGYGKTRLPPSTQLLKPHLWAIPPTLLLPLRRRLSQQATGKARPQHFERAPVRLPRCPDEMIIHRNRRREQALHLASKVWLQRQASGRWALCLQNSSLRHRNRNNRRGRRQQKNLASLIGLKGFGDVRNVLKIVSSVDFFKRGANLSIDEANK